MLQVVKVTTQFKNYVLLRTNNNHEARKIPILLTRHAGGSVVALLYHHRGYCGGSCCVASLAADWTSTRQRLVAAALAAMYKVPDNQISVEDAPDAKCNHLVAAATSADKIDTGISRPDSVSARPI